MAFRSAEIMTLQDLHTIQKTIGARSVGDAVDAFRRACAFHNTSPVLSNEVIELLKKERYFDETGEDFPDLD